MPKKLFNIYVAFTDGLAYVRINTRVSYTILRSDWDALTSLYSVNLAEIIDLNNDKLKSNEVLYKANLNQLDDLVKFLKRHDLELNKESSEKEFTVTIKNNDGAQCTTEQAAEAFRQLGSSVRKTDLYQKIGKKLNNAINAMHDCDIRTLKGSDSVDDLLATIHKCDITIPKLEEELKNIQKELRKLGKELGINGSNND